MYKVRLVNSHEIGLKDNIELFEDGYRTIEKSGNYEWWYLDSKYPDGSSLVNMFFTKPITSLSKKNRPYVTLDYKNPNGTEVHEVLKSDDYHFSKEKCDVRIGECYIRGDLNHYEIYFKNRGVECKLTLDGNVPSWRPEGGQIYFGKKDYFAWLPSVPEGKVDGTLISDGKQIDLLGTGYHDHNWGNKLMVLLMNDWYWGRAKIGDYVVVSSYIYANKKGKYTPTPVFMLSKDGKILTGDASKYLTYEEKDFYKDTYINRYVAKTLIYDYNDKENDIHYRITYTKKDDVEKHNSKDIMGNLLAIIMKLVSFKPSYLRMSGTAKLEKIVNNEVVEVIESPAMWEQMAFRNDRIK